MICHSSHYFICRESTDHSSSFFFCFVFFFMYVRPCVCVCVCMRLLTFMPALVSSFSSRVDTLWTSAPLLSLMLDSIFFFCRFTCEFKSLLLRRRLSCPFLFPLPYTYTFINTAYLATLKRLVSQNMWNKMQNSCTKMRKVKMRGAQQTEHGVTRIFSCILLQSHTVLKCRWWKCAASSICSLSANNYSDMTIWRLTGRTPRRTT